MGHLKYDMGLRQRRKKVLLDIRQAQREKRFDSIFTSQESWNLENWKLEKENSKRENLDRISN